MNTSPHKRKRALRGTTTSYLRHMIFGTCLIFGVLLLLLKMTANNSHAQDAAVAAAENQRADHAQNRLAQYIATLNNAEEQIHTSKPVISPDGHFAAITIVPLGNETAFLARTQIYDLATGKVGQTFPGFTPSWLDSSTQLQLETMNRGLSVYQIDKTMRAEHAAEEPITSATVPTPGSAPTALTTPIQLQMTTYPETIRVAHHPSNGCRDVPAWQVDIIPFEEYVARVVPAETPSWWPIDALAAQAVAARTYGWRQILAGRADYDVTDWANFQMMCDERYQNSDTAVAMTQGQYLVALDDAGATPISAMYSAENGHPTLTNNNVSYLQSVPDRFALGRTRWGHGYGLSQWGAYRRAGVGQSYRQILGHYYSNIYLRNGLEPALALGALLGVDGMQTLATDSIALRAMRPPGLAADYLISATAGLTEAVAIESQEGRTEAISWRSPTPLADGTAITASLWISGLFQEQVTWVVDHQVPPPPPVMLPPVITTTVVTLTASADTGTPLLSAGWHWAGAALSHTANSGAVISDTTTATGAAWAAEPGRHSAGVWYGPYTTALPANHNYRALFWLRAAISPTITHAAAPIAHLDVTDDEGRTLLGLRDLHASDFVDAATYTPIAVDFHLFSAPSGLEFRVTWPGLVGLALDRVEIWQLPDSLENTAVPATQGAIRAATTASFGWTVAGYGVEQILQARATDSAGNLSAVQQYTLTIVDQSAPIFSPVTESATWVATNLLTLTITVSDTLSGIDLNAGALRVSSANFVSTPPVKLNKQELSPLRATMSAVIHDLSDGIYTATFTAYDLAGNFAEQSYPIRVDTTAPTVTISSSGQAIGAWYLEPLTLTVAALDRGSGVHTIYHVHQNSIQTPGVTAIYTAPLVLKQGGSYTTTAWAIDQAHNQSSAITQRVQLDLAAPTLLLSQSAVNATTVHVAWQATDDGSGVTTLEFEIQRDENGWEALPGPQKVADLRLEVTVDPRQKTRLRGRAMDRLGRMSEWVEIELWVATDWIFLPLVNR